MIKNTLKYQINRLILPAILTIFISSCGNNDEETTVEDESPKTDVQKSAVVVGAGLAGLTAAYELEQNGYLVTVLEAKNTVGGRVGSLTMGEQHGEIGGEFIDGESVHTEIHRYANQFSVEITDAGYWGEIESGAYYIDGQLITYSEFDENYDEVTVNEYYRFYDELYLLADIIQDPKDPLLAEDATLYDQMNMQTWINNLNLEPAAKLLAEHTIRGEFDEPSEVSVLFIAQHSKVYEIVEDDDIEVFRFLKGGKAFTSAFTNNIEGEILLEHPVTAITQSNDEVTIIAADKEFVADVVVVTVPLKVLNYIEFTPSLPENIINAANELNYGAHTKVLLHYSKRFWLDQGLGGETLVTGLPIGWTWETTERQAGEAGILVTYTSGDFSMMQKDWTDQDIIENKLTQIEMLYPDSTQHFVEASVHDWINDDWTKGGFLAYGPGQITQYWGLFKDPVGRIYFAGEHTDDLYIGYMEGAVRSGVRVAKQITAQ